MCPSFINGVDVKSAVRLQVGVDGVPHARDDCILHAHEDGVSHAREEAVNVRSGVKHDGRRGALYTLQDFIIKQLRLLNSEKNS